MIKKKTQELLDDYEQHKIIYDEFAARLKTIIEEILNLEKCNFVFVESRSKQLESLRRKLELGKFNDIRSVNDLAGVRITTYVYADIKKLKNFFQVFLKYHH